MSDHKIERNKKRWIRFNLSRALLWIGIIPVALLFGWLGSVVFVAACSLYANAASDFAAYRADSDKQLDRMEEMIEQILDKLKEGGDRT